MKRQFFLLLLLCLNFCSAHLFAQRAPLIKQWDKTFGGNNYDGLSDFVQTPDGGYLLFGTSYSDTSGDKTAIQKSKYEYWLVRVNADGNKVWDKTYAGTASSSNFAVKIIKLQDGNYLLCGRSDSNIGNDKSEDSRGGSGDFWIIKINTDGDKIWDKTFGGDQVDWLNDVIPTTDGGFLLAGTSDSPLSGDKSYELKGRMDFWMVKTDANGNKQWDRSFGASSQSRVLYSVIRETPDGGYLIGGNTEADAGGDKSENSKGLNDFWIIKTDASGNKLWDKTIGGIWEDYLHDCLVNPDGTLIFAGATTGFAGGDKSQNGKGDRDFWIIKTDDLGNKIWDRTIGGENGEAIPRVTLMSDGGYLLSGTSVSQIGYDKSENSNNIDYWIVKIDSEGRKVWDKTIGGYSNDFLLKTLITDEGDYILGGHSNSRSGVDKTENSRGDADFWLVKLWNFSKSVGLQAIEPATAGNEGTAIVDIYGSPFDTNATAKLVGSGQELIAESIIYVDSFLIKAVFNVDRKPLGRYSVICTLKDGETDTLVDAFTLEKVSRGERCAQITARDLVRNGTENTIFVSIQNTGNVTEYNVPVWVAIGLEDTSIHVRFDYVNNSLLAPEWQNVDFQDVTNKFYHNGKTYFPIFIPAIERNSLMTLPLSVNAPITPDTDYSIETWTNENWYGQRFDRDGKNCFYVGLSSILAEAVPEAVNALPTPPMHGCLKSVSDSLIPKLARINDRWLLSNANSVIPVQSLWYGSALDVLNCLNITVNENQKAELRSAINRFLRTGISAQTEDKYVKCVANFNHVSYPCRAEYEVPYVSQTNFDRNNDEQITESETDSLTMTANDCLKSSYLFGKNCEHKLNVRVVASCDPNAKAGNAGPRNFLAKTGKMSYTIYFENKPEASAPAVDVYIIDTLDAKVYDLKSLRFGTVGFGDYQGVSKSDYREMYTDIDMRPNKPYIVRVTGNINEKTGIVKWHFTTLDAQTLKPITDPLGGFLPANKTSPEGQGFVNFNLSLWENLPSGTLIRNRATIIFDKNETILTNVWENRLDVIAPESRVKDLPPTTTETNFNVSWSGTDNMNGSGLRFFNVYVSENDSDFVLWKHHTKETSARFYGTVKHSYRFYSVATDSVHNIETAPENFDAQIRIEPNSREDVFNAEEIYLSEAQPNPFKTTSQIRFYVPTNQPVTLKVLDLQGKELLTLFEGSAEKGFHTFSLKEIPTGIYFVRMTTEKGILTKKVVSVK